MRKDALKYEEAVSQLEDIVKKMESGNMDMDSLCDNLKTAQQLIKLCKAKLRKTNDEVTKILGDDMAESIK